MRESIDRGALHLLYLITDILGKMHHMKIVLIVLIICSLGIGCAKQRYKIIPTETEVVLVLPDSVDITTVAMYSFLDDRDGKEYLALLDKPGMRILLFSVEGGDTIGALSLPSIGGQPKLVAMRGKDSAVVYYDYTNTIVTLAGPTNTYMRYPLSNLLVKNGHQFFVNGMLFLKNAAVLSCGPESVSLQQGYHEFPPFAEVKLGDTSITEVSFFGEQPGAYSNKEMDYMYDNPLLTSSANNTFKALWPVCLTRYTYENQKLISKKDFQLRTARTNIPFRTSDVKSMSFYRTYQDTSGEIVRLAADTRRGLDYLVCRHSQPEMDENGLRNDIFDSGHTIAVIGEDGVVQYEYVEGRRGYTSGVMLVTSDGLLLQRIPTPREKLFSRKMRFSKLSVVKQ